MNKYLKPTEVFCKIYYLADEIKFFRNIYFSHLKAGSNYSLGDHDNDGDCYLNFKNIEIYNDILEKSKEFPIAVEILENEGEYMRYNPWFFLYKDTQVITSLDEDNEYSFNFEEWDNALEKNIICDHNIEYHTFPTDPDGEYYVPEYFNKIKFIEKTFQQIFRELAENNIVSPLNKNKGDTHTGDGKFKMPYLDKYVINDISYFRMDYITEKKSYKEIKQNLINMLRKYDEYASAKVVVEIEDPSVKNAFTITYEAQETHIVDGNLKENKVIYFKREFDSRQELNHVLIQSEPEVIYTMDHVSVTLALKSTERTLAYHQTVEDFKPNAGDETTINFVNSPEYRKPLEDRAYEIVKRTKAEEKVEIELELPENEYFRKILPGNKITIKNINDYVNGDYYIAKVSAVIDDVKISYSLEILEKINY